MHLINSPFVFVLSALPSNRVNLLLRFLAREIKFATYEA